MNHREFKQGRHNAGLTQVEAAERLGLSQPYLSQLEKGQRPVTPDLAELAVKVYGLPTTALPLPEERGAEVATPPPTLARQLAALGYPGFAHLAPEPANPAAVVLGALLHHDLETRLAEALPWVLVRYPDIQWTWLMQRAKLADVQNRLGFLVAVAKELASQTEGQPALKYLADVEQQLEHSRLVREDTLCRESMPLAERKWLEKHRSALARHWNLLTGLTAEQLAYEF